MPKALSNLKAIRNIKAYITGNYTPQYKIVI